RDRSSIPIDDKDLFLFAGERFHPLLSRLLPARNRAPGEDRRLCLVRGQGEVDLDQVVDLALLGLADLEAVGDGDVGASGDLLNAVCMLASEADAEPRVDQGLVTRRYENVVLRLSALDPAVGSR